MTYDKATETYIEHEVKLRLHDEKFDLIRADFHKLETKLNSLIALVISGIIIPVLLHWTKIL